MIIGSYVFGSEKVSISERFSSLGKKKVTELKKKTGIDFIYQSKPEENSLTLAVKACKKILKKINEEVESIIFISESHISTIPPSGPLLHQSLDLNKKCFVLDVVQGCSSFPYALIIAINMINSKTIRNCLIVSSEVYTKYINKKNRTCASIFSDAASAIFINKNNIPRVLSSFFFTDGEGKDKLFIDNKNKLVMKGSDVFSFTVKEVPFAVNHLLKKSKLKLQNIEQFFFHQASNIVLDTLKNKLGIPDNKFYKNIINIGNTVSSTIPISLIESSKNKKIPTNKPVMLLGFGVGYSLSGGIFSFDKK